MNRSRVHTIMHRYGVVGLLFVCAFSAAYPLPLTVDRDDPQKGNVLGRNHLQQRKVSRPQKSLLLHASQVVSLDKYYLTHFWISTNRLLLVTSAKPTRSYDNMKTDTWKGQATMLDLRTGSRHKLEGLTRIFQNMEAMPGNFETSPGGKWLKWTNWDSGDGWPNPVVARWNGSGFQHWEQDKFSYTYWLDDHRWVEEEARDSDDAKDLKRVILHDATQKKTSTFILKSKERQRLIRAHYAVCAHGFLSSVTTRKASSNVIIFETPLPETRNSVLDEKMLHLHTYRITMPDGAKVQAVIVSPKTRRVMSSASHKNCR